ncbi:MAG: DUF1499 domain-containing protein [Oceanicoccus sp.]
MSPTTDSSNAAVSKGALRIRNIALIVLILLPVSALGTRFGLWPFTIGIQLLLGAVVVGLLIQVINAIWLLRKPATATKSALRWASLFALPALILVAAFMQAQGDAKAGIHNISTDTDNPPQFIAAIEQRGANSNPLEYTKEVATVQQKFFPDVNTIATNQTPQQAFENSLATAQSLGWEVYAQDPDQGHVEAVDTSFWFGYKDDIVIRITANDSGSAVDLRSVSRVGVSDLGANAKRIGKFSEAFRKNGG